MIRNILCIGLLCAAPLAYAAPAEVSIVAVVDSNIITSKDVDDRIDFIRVTAALPNTDEARARMRPQVIRQLVDETLQLQEAQRLGLMPDAKDMAQAIASIEQQRGMSSGTLLTTLAADGVSERYFKHQLEAQVAWSKIVNKRIRPLVKVSEEEIERARAQAASNPTQRTEYSILLLPLPVEKPEQDAEVKALAEHFVRELSHGASFDNIARQAAPASAPPSPFWVEASALDPALAKALSTAVAGSVSSPVRTAEGYVIVQLIDKRDALAAATTTISELTVKLFTLSPKGEATPSADELAAAAEAVRAAPGTCEDAGNGATVPETMAVDATLLQQPLESFSEGFQPFLQSLSVGSVSAPVATPYGLQMVLLCERVDVPPALADKDRTYQRLMSEKMDLEIRKTMRNLRRDAFIEMK